MISLQENIDVLHSSPKNYYFTKENIVLGCSSIDTIKKLCVKQKNFTLSGIIPDKFLNTMDKSMFLYLN